MSDWGKGVTNNTIEWGRGSTNNSIDWGSVYGDSWSGETELELEVGFLLDQYSGSEAAYSVRKLSGSYSSSVLRVRRSSDNAEQDIGFDSNGDLDTSALTTFVGASNGFVVTWYDQSGNGNDATQTTAASQPQIVSSGSVITSESLPTVDFDGSNDYLELTGTPTVDNLSIFNVFQSDNSSQDSVIFAKAEDASNFISSGIRANQRAVRYVNNGSLTDKSISFTDTTSAHHSSVIAETTTPDVDIWVDGSQGAGSQNPRASSIATQGIIGARQGGLSAFNGKISEFVLYPTDETANRTAIESNINAYYNIYGDYTPVLDSMTATPQFAWSVYQLSSSVTNCFECRRSSDNAETTIGFDSNGLLDTAAISSHIGGGNGFSTTFYGAELSRNGVETVASGQVQYRASGVLDKPCFVLASGTTGSYPLNTSITGTAALTAFILFTAKSTRVNGSTMSYLTDGTLTRGTMRELSDGTKTNIGIFNGVGNDSASAGGYLQNDTTYLIEVRRDASNNTEYFLNNVSLGTGSFSNAPDITTMLGANSNAEAELYEIVYFNSDISAADKATYITHINNEYGLSL